MSEVRHKLVRVDMKYHVKRFFQDGHTPLWITKRAKIDGTKPGPFVTYAFLNEAIESIRSEPDGKESVIELSETSRQHLKSLNFTKERLEKLIGNKLENW